MTVNTSTSKTIALGDGSATAFGFDFIGVAAAYISVIYTDASGNETVLTATNYSIALNAPVTGAIWGVGGTVTYPLAGSPIASGTTLTIFRTLPLEQAIVLQNQASYGQFGAAAERAVDLLEMQLQQVSEASDRAIKANITNTSLPDDLPPAAQAAGKGVIFSPDGNSLIAGEIPASGVISSAMAPVVGAASLAAGRTAFGLGNIAVEGIGPGLQDNGAGLLRVAQPVEYVAISRVIIDTDFMKQLVVTGPVTLTTSRANTYWNGYGFWVDARSGPVTIAIQLTDNFPGLSSGISLVIPADSVVFISTDAANSGAWLTKWMPEVTPQFQCQLSKVGGNLQLARCNGSNVFINGRLYQIPVTPLALAPTGLAASTLYYAYARINNVGAMEFELSTTVPALDANWGVPIKTGDSSRTLVGWVRTDSGAVFQDSATQRLVRSYYNDPGIALLNHFTANRTVPGASYVEINAEIRIELLVWSGEVVQIESNGPCSNGTANGTAETSIGIDSATPEDTDFVAGSPSAAFACSFSVSLFKTGLSEGYHFITLLGRTNGVGTATWNGNATAGSRVTLRGFTKR